jgi:hypothetical protein
MSVIPFTELGQPVIPMAFLHWLTEQIDEFVSTRGKPDESPPGSISYLDLPSVRASPDIDRCQSLLLVEECPQIDRVRLDL